MLRKIIRIDEERCDGCGLCANACHEGAIGLVNGKAKLLRESFCDGMGDCLPACPKDAIHFEEREAPAYDAEAVAASKRKVLKPTAALQAGALENWPVQLKLTPVKSQAFAGADLLVAADCSAFACGDFHTRFLAGKSLVVGCSKLDGVDYSEKLTAILRENDVNSVTVVRMEVPCCGGLERAVKTAISASGKELPLRVTVLSAEGRVIVER